MEIVTRLEEIILIAIWKLKENAYGVSINMEVSKIYGKDYTMGSLYFALDQLYRKELVYKKSGNPTSERGGRSKVFYSLTDEGKNALVKVNELNKKVHSDLSDVVLNTLK